MIRHFQGPLRARSDASTACVQDAKQVHQCYNLASLTQPARLVRTTTGKHCHDLVVWCVLNCLLDEIKCTGISAVPPWQALNNGFIAAFS